MKILAAIDEHEESSWAARAALALAQRLSAEPRFVHVVPASEPALLPVANLTESRKKAIAAARGQIVDRATRWCSKTPWESRVDELVEVEAGKVAPTLVELAAEADLLVLGPHHRDDAFDFGRTVRGVLAHQPCPLWVQKTESIDIRRVVAPVDLSPVSGRVLTWARDTARALEASVHALHFFEGPYFAYGASMEPLAGVPTYVVDEARDEARKKFERTVEGIDWQGVEHSSQFTESDPLASILETCREGDLLVCGAHGEGWLSTTFLGSNAYFLLKSSKVPIVTVRRSSES